MYNGYAQSAKLNGYPISPFKAKSLTDPSVFDFYNKLLDGKNQRQWTEFTAYNVALEETLFNNRVGVELVYDNQESDWGQTRYLSGDATAITVDIMDTLLNGIPNPNFGKPMVVASGGGAGGDWTNKKRETMRATVFGTLDFADFMDKKSMLTKILGKHTFTGLYTTQENTTQTRTWKNWYLGNNFGIVGDSAVNQAVRDVIVLDYLSDYSMVNLTSPAGLNLSNLQGKRIPAAGTAMVFDNTPTAAFDAVIAAKLNSKTGIVTDPITGVSVYHPEYDNNNIANYKGWRQMPTELVNNFALFGDKGGNYGSATHTVSKVDSQAFVWQGHMLDDVLVPMVGWRKDTELFRSAGSAPVTGATKGVGPIRTHPSGCSRPNRSPTRRQIFAPIPRRPVSRSRGASWRRARSSSTTSCPWA
ncbi:MAG: hypothetical protein IPL39_11155 [Opitutaceae bacterium]|nr:hypothetical protein [Opitutaceae bacterium]